MHIGLHHNAVLPTRRYGGTERIVYWLAKALIEKGHQVSLIARLGSHIPGTKLIPIEQWQAHLPTEASKFHLDLVHYQATPQLENQAEPAYPYMVTIHGNGKPGETFLPNTVFVSAKHAENHTSTFFVLNGIDPSEYHLAPQKQQQLVFLAKTSWKVKNLRGAMELAQAASLPLKIMGNSKKESGLHSLRSLFKPSLKKIKYKGMVDDLEKRSILAEAQALLFPVRWQEPFGIALTEALASGCAIFGTPYGSLPEIVTPEVGVLSTRATDLLYAIKHFSFHPERCRARVFDGLTHLDMAKKYLSYYEQILNEKHLSSLLNGKRVLNQPKSRFQVSSETLLDYEFLNSGRI